MEVNTIYRVRDISRILKAFSLTKEDKIFIIKNIYNSLNELRFFILEYNNKLNLLVKTNSEGKIYKLKCPEISNMYIKEFLLKNSILRTKYNVQENNFTKNIKRNSFSIPIINVPYQRISVQNINHGKYAATLYIRKQENLNYRITAYDKAADLAVNKLIHIIYEQYNSYLENESKTFNTKEKRIHAMINNISYSNLDTVQENCKTISDTSDELDIEIET